MIMEFYGLGQDAFSLSPDLDFLFLSNSHEEAVAHLVYGLEQNEDIILLCGDIGTGKTLALHRLVDQVSKSFIPVLITVTTLDYDQFLRLFLMKLGVEVEGHSGAADLVFELEQQLVRIRQEGRKVLLVVDEGQNLGIDYLESVRLLMNLGQPGGQSLQMVLAGQLGLKSKLNSPQMRQLKQRIRVDYQLEYMTREELGGYVEHRLLVAGRRDPLFTSGALDKIHAISLGVPRIVNYLASKALLSGFVEEAKQIKASHVEDSAPGVPTAGDAEFSEPVKVMEEVAVEVKVPPSPPAEHLGVEQRKTYAHRADNGRRGRFVLIAVFVVVAAVFVYYMRPQWSGYFDQLTEKIGGGESEVAEDQTPRLTGEPQNGGVKVADGKQLETTDVDVPDQQANPASDPVVSKTVAPALEASAADVQAPNDFVVHVASFKAPDRAENFRRRMAELGFSADVRTVTNESGTLWNRVFLGPFSSRDSARVYAENLRSDGTINYYQVVKQGS